MKAPAIFLFCIVTSSGIVAQQPCEDRIDSIPAATLQNASQVSDLIRDYPKEEYAKLIDYVSIEISTVHFGKTIIATANTEALTAEQQTHLKTADIGSRVGIKIKFQYKDPANNDLGSGRTIKEMFYIYKASTLPPSGLPPCGC